MARSAGLPVTWFFLSVAVSLRFACCSSPPLPQCSALIWARNLIVQPLEVPDDSRTASVPTHLFEGPRPDAFNAVESRSTFATIQADVAGRARVIDGDTIEVALERGSA